MHVIRGIYLVRLLEDDQGSLGQNQKDVEGEEGDSSPCGYPRLTVEGGRVGIPTNSGFRVLACLGLRSSILVLLEIHRM